MAETLTLPARSTTPKLIEATGRGALSTGRNLGEQLGDRIVAAIDSLYEYESFRVQQPWWMPYPVYLYMAQWRALDTLQPVVERAYPDLATRIAGMAEGAGVQVESLYLFHAMEAMLTSCDNVASCPMAACTAVAISEAASLEGGPMLHHNFDNVPLSAPLLALRRRQSPGGYRCLEFTCAPLAGAIDGINDAGLCITYNFAWTTAPGIPAPPVSMAVSSTLDRCASVAEAIRFLKKQQLCGGSLLMLADAGGQLARMEWSGRRVAVQRLTDSHNASPSFLHHSNTYRTRLKGFEVSAQACFGNGAPPALRGERVLESADQRDQRLRALIAQQPQYSADDLKAVMTDHGENDRADGNTVCMHGPYWQTIASLQFHPRQRLLRAGYGHACETEYVDFAL